MCGSKRLSYAASNALTTQKASVKEKIPPCGAKEKQVNVLDAPGMDRVPMQHARPVLGCLFKKGVQCVPLAALHERREQAKLLCEKNPRACATLGGRRVGEKVADDKRKKPYILGLFWYPVGESNPCSRRERAVS